jgi:Tfp pilus assembly protein PilF
MSSERLNLLHKFYEEDPSDPFNLYALALEYLNTDIAKAEQFFQILLDKHKDYLPTYYHAARLFQDKGEKDKAISVYENGILLARTCGDRKAQRELQSAYDELMFE